MKLKLYPLARRASAFSIVEVVIAAAISGVMFMSLYAGISWGFANIQVAREELRATQVALEKMETVRMYSWDQINSNGFVPAAFTAPFFPYLSTNTNSSGLVYYGTTTITNALVPDEYTNDMRRVIVTVSWTNNNIGRTRTMETQISQYGMQRYDY